MDIKAWLESIELSEYISNFTDNDITFEDLQELSAEELKDDLGIKSLGHRKRILKAIDLLDELSETDLEITEKYPYIISYPYKMMLEEKNGFKKLQLLKDVFLNMLKYMGLLLAAEYFNSSLKNNEINNLFREKLYQPHFGHWNHFIREVLEILKKEEHVFSIPELADFYERVQTGKKSKKFSIQASHTDENGDVINTTKKLTAIDGLINFRNKFIGHGLTLSDEESDEIFDTYFPLLLHLLENMAFCSEYPIYRFNGGRIERLMGTGIQIDDQAEPQTDTSIWMETAGKKNMSMLPFLIPPEQFIADIKGASRLFVYEQHTSKRIIYFSPEQKSGETAGEPVKQLAQMLEIKSRFDQVKARDIDYEAAFNIFSGYSRNIIKELENEKKILKGTYCSRAETETDIESFFSSESAILFLASEAGSGKTNILAQTAVKSLEAGVPGLLLRAIRLSKDDIEECLRDILNLADGEELIQSAFLNAEGKLPVRIIIDGLNEHKNPKAFFDSVYKLLKKLPPESIQLVLAWRTSGLSELPEINSDFKSFFYRKDTSYAVQLAPMTRAETAALWQKYTAHTSKQYRPMFSLEEIEQRDRVFTAALSNPLLLRMFMELYNRKKLPAAGAIRLWPQWYKDICDKHPGTAEFMEVLADKMSCMKTLAVEFDSLFDDPETSDVVRDLDINSPYRKLLSSGVLSLFFKEGILYVSFTVEASFHYILSMILQRKLSEGSLQPSELTLKTTDFPARNRAAAMVLEKEVSLGNSELFKNYCISTAMLPAAAAEAALFLIENEGPAAVCSMLIEKTPAACALIHLETDFMLEKRLDTDLRAAVFAELYKRKEELPLSEKKKVIYRYCLVSHEAGDYELELKLAEEYQGLCGGDNFEDEIEAGFADIRIATALRKLMRHRDESETEELGRRAYEYGRRAVERLQPRLADNSPVFDELWNLMAKIHEYRLEWNDAVSFGKKRIEFIINKMGKRNPLLASAYNNTAISLREMGKREESVEFSKRAIKAVEENLDPNHIEMAYAYWTLAYSRAKFGEMTAARDEMKTVLTLLKRLLPDDHPNIRIANEHLAEYELKSREEN